MEYEVREIVQKKELIGYGVFEFSAPRKAKPVHTFYFDLNDETGPPIAHHLALLMAHDLNAGIE
jgi:hypothetical protein